MKNAWQLCSMHARIVQSPMIFYQLIFNYTPIDTINIVVQTSKLTNTTWSNFISNHFPFILLVVVVFNMFIIFLLKNSYRNVNEQIIHDSPVAEEAPVPRKLGEEVQPRRVSASQPEPQHQ